MEPGASPPSSTALLIQQHVAYIQRLNAKKEDFEHFVTEHLRMSGYYWGLTALSLLRHLPVIEKDVLISWVLTCQHEDGGFGGSPEGDSHLLYTLSALQVLALYDSLDKCDRQACATFVSKLQKEDGSFAGDEWGEIDTRFSYIALASLSILGRSELISVPKAVEFIKRCRNFDGGYGCIPGAESHAGQVFCCVGALAIAGALEDISSKESDKLAWWLGTARHLYASYTRNVDLYHPIFGKFKNNSEAQPVDLLTLRIAERQTGDGGLNGRPEKVADVCYSWWVLSALRILGRIDWIDKEALKKFILACQDSAGGIADKPGNVPDVFHTFFGVAGLSLLGEKELQEVDAVYALPTETLQKLGLRPKIN